MIIGITEAAAICAVITCGGVDEVDEAPPPALMEITDIEAMFITPEYAPYKDEETAEYNRTINELKDEVTSLNDEVDVLEAEIDAKEATKAQADSDSDNSSVAPTDKGNDEPHAVGQTFEATYYDAYCGTCGEWGGITATGDDISNSIYVRGKRVVAVDPAQIPLGSTVKVTTPHETFEALALDTGGDITHGRIDILVESEAEAYRLGRHNVTVEILN